MKEDIEEEVKQEVVVEDSRSELQPQNDFYDML
jgi:hypothetical protein